MPLGKRTSGGGAIVGAGVHFRVAVDVHGTALAPAAGAAAGAAHVLGVVKAAVAAVLAAARVGPAVADLALLLLLVLLLLLALVARLVVQELAVAPVLAVALQEELAHLAGRQQEENKRRR